MALCGGLEAGAKVCLPENPKFFGPGVVSEDGRIAGSESVGLAYGK